MAFRSARRGPEGSFTPPDAQEELQALLSPEEDEKAKQLRMLLEWGDPNYTPDTTLSEPSAPPEAGDPVLAAQRFPRPAPLTEMHDFDQQPIVTPQPITEPDPLPEPVPRAPMEDYATTDPFELAALRTRRGVVHDRPITEPDFFPREQEGPFKPETPMETLDKMTRPIRFAGQKAAELGSLVYSLPAAGAQFLAGIEANTPREDVPRSARRVGSMQAVEESSTMQNVADYLNELAEGTRGLTKTVTGTTGLKPETPIEQAGVWTGEYFMPMKGALTTTALTLTGVAARAGLTALGDNEIPIPSVTTPAEAGFAESRGTTKPPSALSGPPVAVAPTPGAPTMPAPTIPGSTIVPGSAIVPSVSHTGREKKGAEAPEIPKGMTIPPPDMRTTTPPKLSQGKGRLNRAGERVGAESDEAFAQRVENAWVAKEIAARTYSPTAMEIFQSVAGMQKTSQSEYKAMGVVGGTLVGMILAPKVFARFSRAELPAVRTVEAGTAREVANAAPGTIATSTLGDAIRAADDINAPLARIAERNGIPEEVVDSLDKNFRITTRQGGRALADSAVETARMETPSFRFNAPVALNDMARQSTAQSDTYLKLWDRADELTLMSQMRKYEVAEGKTPKAGPPTLEGQTIDDVTKAISDLERADPGLRDMLKANQGWNKAIRDFQASGEYGTVPKKHLDPNKPAMDDGSQAFLNSSRPNALGNLRGKETGANAIESQADMARGLIKERLDNEAVGRYVDAMRKRNPDSFVEVTKEQLAENPSWKQNVVSFKRRGQTEYYTTDPFLADVLRLDHSTITGWGGNALHSTKRMLESTTTGVLAPNFAVTSAIRSYWIAKFTTEQGFKAPTAVGTLLAIPQQLIPQIAKSISRGLENGSAGMLGEIYGKGWMDGLSKRLAVVYDESVYAQLKAAGSHRGSILEQQARAKGLEDVTKWFDANAAASNTVRGAQHFWNAWKASIESIHNGPAFNFVKRNLGTESAPDLALRARRLTGDPRVGGEYYVGRDSNKRPIRFETDGSMTQRIAHTLVKGYGWTAENIGKNAIPWWNPTLQGAKRIGEAFLHDPVRFTRSTALYAMAPAVGLLYYAKALDAQGGDPNGRSYVDWILNGRSAFNRQMNFAVPLPGQPVEKSMEITFFHELNPFKRAAEIAWHHMLGSGIPKDDPSHFLLGMPDNVTAGRPLNEDLWIAAHMFLDTAVIPPMPPIVNVAFGAYGIRGPQGMFGGVAYPVKGDPFNQNGGLPTSLELATRAMFGGVAESLGGFYAASTQSEGGWWNAINNGMKQARDINIRKTPILRDLVGTLPDVSNVTDLSKEVFEHQKEFNDLARFFKKWTVNEGRIGIKPASTGGGVAVQEQYGLQQLSAGNPGLQQGMPINPLYNEYMQEFYNRYMKESPNMVKGIDQGGIAFKSLWRNYGTATQKLERLKDVNHGTYDRWQREMEPDAKEELEQSGIDTTNRQDVVNFYKKKQFEALRVINYVRRAVETAMSNKYGKEIRLKDLKPFDQPSEPAPFMYPDLM